MCSLSFKVVKSGRGDSAKLHFVRITWTILNRTTSRGFTLTTAFLRELSMIERNTMRQKQISFLVATLLISSYTLCLQAFEIGRFQITATTSGAYVVDTATGKVWKEVSRSLSKKFFDEKLSFDSSADEALKAIDLDKMLQYFGFRPFRPENLKTIPSFFKFDYRSSGPIQGARLWIRIDDSTWVERYPDGFESKFHVFGRTEVDGLTGSVLVKFAGDPNVTLNDNKGGQLIFIPDIGSRQMNFYYWKVSRGDTSWTRLAPMIEVN